MKSDTMQIALELLFGKIRVTHGMTSLNLQFLNISPKNLPMANLLFMVEQFSSNLLPSSFPLSLFIQLIIFPYEIFTSFFYLWSISSTFFVQILCTKVRSKPNSKQRKDVCTKNLHVKRWWNWHLLTLSSLLLLST